ncbi:MAG: hypothetical protein Ct9H300mP28_06530 [Pseudomonadota bacterium]|nr:MAG: hypothetical protein Ct9H300mP28_06530 [Pseudomonadota bacterium]
MQMAPMAMTLADDKAIENVALTFPPSNKLPSVFQNG